MIKNDKHSPEWLPITCAIGLPDYELFVSVINQGIDSHLEAFIKSEFGIEEGRPGRFVFNFHTTEVPLLLRRLSELEPSDHIEHWIADIEWAAKSDKQRRF